MISTKVFRINRCINDMLDNIDPNTNEVEIEYVVDIITQARELRDLILYRMDYYDTNNIPVSPEDIDTLDYIDEALYFLGTAV